MKHEDDQWETQIRKGPFAASPLQRTTNVRCYIRRSR